MIRQSEIINCATVRSYVNSQLVYAGSWRHLLDPLLNLLFVKVIAWQVEVALGWIRLLWHRSFDCEHWFGVWG